MSKFIASLAVSGIVALTLVACSTPAVASCTPTASGSASEKISVVGKTGAEPKVTMPPAFDVSKTERSVITHGDGKVATDGQIVIANFVFYNASTGAKIQATDYSAAGAKPFLIDKGKSLPGIYEALHCSVAGDRVVATIPPADLFGSQGLPNNDGSYVVGPTDTVVFVFDIKKVEPAPTANPSPSPSASPAALPVPQEWKSNIPTVDLSGKTPVVTIPKTDPSPSLELKVLTPGDGAVVTKDSTVTVDYQGISWGTGVIFDQSYTRGEPSPFKVAGVIQGFGAAMVGQKVGTTLLVTIPPKYAYGADPAANKLGGQTLVFLIQIRKTA